MLNLVLFVRAYGEQGVILITYMMNKRNIKIALVLLTILFVTCKNKERVIYQTSIQKVLEEGKAFITPKDTILVLQKSNSDSLSLYEIKKILSQRHLLEMNQMVIKKRDEIILQKQILGHECLMVKNISRLPRFKKNRIYITFSNLVKCRDNILALKCSVGYARLHTTTYYIEFIKKDDEKWVMNHVQILAFG